MRLFPSTDRVSLTILLAAACSRVSASPFAKRRPGVGPFASNAVSYAGQASSDVYPPTATLPNTALFPDESQVGYFGPTETGAEPFVLQTQPAGSFIGNKSPFAPLVAGQILGSSNGSFSLFEPWGSLSPWQSVDSSYYGLNNASPVIPDQCSLTQVHILYRHGARYPVGESPPYLFAEKIRNATATGFAAKGPLAFLNTWVYTLGNEILTPFGRQQEFDLGVAFRQNYGKLLNNFTEAGVLPVFRAPSLDRTVKTALNFMAGFFGIPEYQTQASLEIVVQAPGFNNTAEPSETCANSLVASRGAIGTTVATNYANTAFNATAQRLQKLIAGVEILPADVVAMLQLCSYETVGLGYSAFCPLFTAEDYRTYEYYWDLTYYYNNGFGSPVAAAQGLGWVQELISRLQESPIQVYNSTTNSTLDSNPATFPLNQSIYADATHEVALLDTLTALNLSALFDPKPLPLNTRPASQVFYASKVVPFATHLVTQVMECSDMVPTKQMRFILNDAVIPLHGSYNGCPVNAHGLCSLDTVLQALLRRTSQINFQYDCFGNYTAQPGNNYNGRALSS